MRLAPIDAAALAALHNGQTYIASYSWKRRGLAPPSFGAGDCVSGLCQTVQHPGIVGCEHLVSAVVVGAPDLTFAEGRTSRIMPGTGALRYLCTL